MITTFLSTDNNIPHDDDDGCLNNNNNNTNTNSDSIQCLPNYITNQSTDMMNDITSHPSIPPPILIPAASHQFQHQHHDQQHYHHNHHHHSNHNHHHVDEHQAYMHYTVDSDEHSIQVNDISAVIHNDNNNVNMNPYINEINNCETALPQDVANVAAAAVAAVAAAAIDNTDYSSSSLNHHHHHNHHHFNPHPHFYPHSHNHYYQYYLQNQQQHQEKHQNNYEQADVIPLHHNHTNNDFNSLLLLQQQQQHQSEMPSHQRQSDVENGNITRKTINNNNSNINMNSFHETTNYNSVKHKLNRVKSPIKINISDDDDDEVVKRQNQNILKSGMLCLICEDKATGKHYGAYSCDGCKGFFRRSVRRKHSYTCRHKRSCIVTKDKRNQCRFCRFRKCFRVGMKESAVQKERDKISNRHSTYDTNSSIQSSLDLQKLIQAETIANCALQKNYLGQTNKSDIYSKDSLRQSISTGLENNLANVNDICDSMRTQLLFLIEWAKNIPAFTSLSINDQIVLLQAHAGEMLILGAVWRSMTLVSNHKTTFNQSNGYEEQHVKFDHKLDDTNLSNSTTMKSVTTSAVNAPAASWNPAATGAYQYAANADEVDQLKQDELRFSQSANNEPQLILLGNNRIISRKSPQPEISEIASMIINQIYQPIQNLCLEEAEMVFFRAIIFFDPSCELLSENGRLLVRSCQYLVQMELMNLMNGKLYLPQGRFGALLLLIPDFRSITYHMIHKLQIARQMGLTKLDGLLSEILLNDTGSSKGKPVNSHVGSTSRCHVSKNKSVQFEEKKHSKAYSSLPKLYPEQNNSYTHVSTSPPSLPPPQPAAELPSSSPSSLSAEAMAAAAAAAAAVSTITHLTSVPIQTEMNQFTDTSLTVVDENSTSNKYIPLKSNPVVHLNLLNKDAENKSNLLETTLHQIPREEDSIKYAIEQQQQQQREEQSPSIHLGVTTASGIPVYTIMNNCENNTSHVLNDNDINNSGNENYATVKRCHFDSLAECYHCSQPVLERINEDNSDEDFNNTNDCNNTNNNNNINDNSDVEHTPMFTTHLAQETFENTQRTEYIANHCPPTLEAGVYYPDNQMYTTYSYNLNPVNVKYNQIKNIPTVYAYNDSKQLIPPENASEYMPQLISSMFTNTQS